VTCSGSKSGVTSKTAGVLPAVSPVKNPRRTSQEPSPHLPHQKITTRACRKAVQSLPIPHPHTHTQPLVSYQAASYGRFCCRPLLYHLKHSNSQLHPAPPSSDTRAPRPANSIQPTSPSLSTSTSTAKACPRAEQAASLEAETPGGPAGEPQWRAVRSRPRCWSCAARRRHPRRSRRCAT